MTETTPNFPPTALVAATERLRQMAREDSWIMNTGHDWDHEAAIAREVLDAALPHLDPDGGVHVIEYREDGWTIRHPLACRLGDLFACRVNRAAEVDVDGPPAAGLGRYVCDIEPDGSFWLGPRIEAGP